MPSKSKKQARFMAAAAHNPRFAKKVGIKRSVARDFNRADAGTGILRKAAGGSVARPGYGIPPVSRPPGLSGSPGGLSDVLRSADKAITGSYGRLRAAVAAPSLGVRKRSRGAA